MALAYVLTYPDAMMAGRTLIGTSQSVSWIYNCWIAGYALLTSAAVLIETGWAGLPIERTSARSTAAVSCSAVVAAVLAIAALATWRVDSLPPLIVGGVWTTLNAAINLGAVVLLGSSLVLILRTMHPRNDLFLWLSLALTALAFGNIVSAVGGARYTVGWYACRLSWLVSGCVLLLYFLDQFVRQHGLLARTAGDLVERTRERDRIWSVSEDLLGVSTFDGYFISLNPAWTRVLGWSEAEIKSMHVDALRHPDDAAMAMAGRTRLADDVTTVRMENRYRHKDGSWRWIAWTMTADQGLIYVAGRHVTAEREAQEALRKAEADAANRQKMEALGQLTGGVAHDFNNLLMVVSGFIPRLKAAVAGDAKASQATEAIDTAARRGAALTRQLLSFSRRQPINPVVIAIGERIEAMVPILASTVGPFIEFKVEVSPNLWPVEVDANEFELALLNLVLNSRDAASGGGAITVAARNRSLQPGDAKATVAGDFVVVLVSDTGTGIPPEILPKVFDPFFTTKPMGKGTGLGLSQVHGFTRQSGGMALIDSAPGKGTTVALYLPRAQDVTEPGEARQSGTIRGGTALLVEDNADVAEVTREMLSQLGYEVHMAAEAERALSLLERHAFCLVLSDIVMPGAMNGIELARTIRRRRPDLPIILVTGYAASAGSAPEFIVLRKPYRFEQLRQAITQVTAPVTLGAGQSC